MKKSMLCILALALLAALLSCGSKGTSSARAAGGSSGVAQVLEEGVAAESEAKAEPSADASQAPDEPETLAEPSVDDPLPEPIAPADGQVDVDLTSLSSTMIYSQVFDMLERPQEYLGKSVRMRGLFGYLYDEYTDQEYFACIIEDATACCAQGIEFVLTGENIYPQDYPPLGSEVTVVGTFSQYMEGEDTYYTLREAHFE